MGLMKTMIQKGDPLIKHFVSYTKPIFPYYHTVSNSYLPHIANLYSYKNESEFIEDLDFILSKYEILQPETLIRCINNKEQVPPNSFLISFDDGLSEIYRNVVPILNRKGVPSVLFVNNRYVDNKTLFYKHKISIIQHEILRGNEKLSIEALGRLLNVKGQNIDVLLRRLSQVSHLEQDKLDEILSLLEVDQNDFLKKHQPYLTTNQLQEIESQGHYVGGHTVNHFPLEKLSLQDQMVEIEDSILWVKENLNVDYTLFSFPFSDAFASMKLINYLFERFPDLVCMGNAGSRTDVTPQIIQRFSLEKAPSAGVGIRANLVYGYYNTLMGNGKIKRK